ncbi:MAG: tRNA pseudouridine(38-40) synthase TruA [Tannerella sp.]|jgi:tRNA pseudouridine38-40 synthase|nr:tRNA pseudouridine(38-40) synthase TruA [Tannerella sp.]
MRRYFIYLSYLGTRYNGWQQQPNGVGVQMLVEEKLSMVLCNKVSVVGAGRTDAGVHARLMVAHFDAVSEITDLHSLAEKLNNMLPGDIAVDKIVPVKDGAHARFSAVARTYKYYISDRKNPFDSEWVVRMPLRKINFESMNDACHYLFDTEDFTSFTKLHSESKTNICKISEAEWHKDGERWVFTITADRFLRNMVRAIVGTLLAVGRGKISQEDFRRIIDAKDRCKAGTSAPARGLALINIVYPDNIFLDK